MLSPKGGNSCANAGVVMVTGPITAAAIPKAATTATAIKTSFEFIGLSSNNNIVYKNSLKLTYRRMNVSYHALVQSNNRMKTEQATIDKGDCQLVCLRSAFVNLLNRWLKYN
jgi:hypothetical protein